MHSTEQHIALIANSLLAHEPSLFVVAVLAKGIGTSTQKIVVMVDGDNGITVEHCADLSRSLGETLETDPILDGPFTLEVGSPGVDYPLDSPRLYAKNIGRTIKVELADGSSLEGELLDATDAGIELAVVDKKKKPRWVKPEKKHKNGPDTLEAQASLAPSAAPEAESGATVVPLFYAQITRSTVQIKF